MASAKELLERAEALHPLLAGFAAESERRRAVHPEAIQALRQAGLFRLSQPRRLGGAELDLRAMHAVVRSLAHACPATSWVLMVLLGHTWILGMFPEEVQDEIAADDPDTLIAGSLAATGRAVAAKNGWRISGRWPFASGVDHARWNLLGVHVAGAAEEQPRQIHVMAPAADCTVNDNWHVMGLKGTGSKELVLDDVFVPAHRALPSAALFLGRSAAAGRHASRLYTMPVVTGLAYHVSAPVLGMAESLWQGFVAATRDRQDKYTGSRKRESAGLQLRVATAELELRTAELLLDRVAGHFDALAEAERPPTVEERAEMRFTVAFAVERCRQAADRLFAAAGANAAYDGSPLQARFRDLTVASHHAMVDLDGAAEQLGRLRLGLEPNSPVL